MAPSPTILCSYAGALRIMDSQCENGPNQGIPSASLFSPQPVGAMGSESSLQLDSLLKLVK